jgi:hypothetical protein
LSSSAALSADEVGPVLALVEVKSTFVACCRGFVIAAAPTAIIAIILLLRYVSLGLTHEILEYHPTF